MGKSIERGERVTACQEANLGEGVIINVFKVLYFYLLGGNSSNGGNDDE